MDAFQNHRVPSHPSQAFRTSEDRNEEDRRLTLIQSSVVETFHTETGEPTRPKPSRLWMIFGIPATLRMAVGVGKMGILWGVCFDMIYGVCTLTFLDFDVWTTSCGFWPHDSRSVKHSLHYTNFTHTHISETSQTNMCFWLFLGMIFSTLRILTPPKRNTSDPPFMTINGASGGNLPHPKDYPYHPCMVYLPTFAYIYHILPLKTTKCR